MISDFYLMKKTFSTFHTTNVLLQQYREKNFKRYSELISHLYMTENFKKYSELISHLLMTEKNNNFLIKSHEAQPTSYTPLPEVNEMYTHNSKREDLGPSRGHCEERFFS